MVSQFVMGSRHSSRRGLLALFGVSIVFAADVTQEQCEKWAASGECEKNSKFMLVTCREACASNHRQSPDYAAAYHCELWAGEGECGAVLGTSAGSEISELTEWTVERRLMVTRMVTRPSPRWTRAPRCYHV